MLGKLSVVTVLLTVPLFLGWHVGADSSHVEVNRVRRDTAQWVRRSDTILLQDFRNGTALNTTSTVWKKCVCDFSGCDCYAEYTDFNGTRLYFRLEHIKSQTRFRITFRDQNRTFSQQFDLTNGTTCYQYRKLTFDQICFLRYGQENNTILDKSCLALSVRIQKYSALAIDYECIKSMSDGSTHVGAMNITQPDLNLFANSTLYLPGAGATHSSSLFALIACIATALLISKMDQ